VVAPLCELKIPSWILHNRDTRFRVSETIDDDRRDLMKIRWPTISEVINGVQDPHYLDALEMDPSCSLTINIYVGKGWNNVLTNHLGRLVLFWEARPFQPSQSVMARAEDLEAGNPVWAREDKESPYTFLGLMEHKVALSSLSNGNRTFMLVLRKTPQSGHVCVSTGSAIGHFKRAAWDFLGLQYPTGLHVRGIFKHPV
jgi:hypothetical protein